MTAATSKPHLVIIGTGMAGGRLLEELMRRSTDHFTISVFGEEPHPNYNRIMLSPLLAGEVSAEDIVLNPLDWYKEHNITLYAGERIVGIDKAAKRVVGDQGTQLEYDHLVFATGSLPARIPTPGQHLNHIYAFRTMADVDSIIHSSKSAKTAVVVGGGLLGLEAAYGLAIKGTKTTVVNRAGHVLNRQLDEAAGEMLRQAMLEKGVDTALNADIKEFTGSDRVTGVALESGEVIAADLVIIAIGITPNTALAHAAGLNVGRGIIVDDYLVTSDPHISGLGECIEHCGETFGLVAPIWDQARLLADRLVFNTQLPYLSSAVPTKLKVSGIDLFSAGEVNGLPEDRIVILQDPSQRAYRKLIIRDQKLVGIVLFGDVQDGNWYFELLEQQSKVDDLLPHLMFGQAFCRQAPEHNNQPENALTGASL
jgi:nitrite reductase (NADH) large subunit